jgi:hypothetical protein
MTFPGSKQVEQLLVAQRNGRVIRSGQERGIATSLVTSHTTLTKDGTPENGIASRCDINRTAVAGARQCGLGCCAGLLLGGGLLGSLRLLLGGKGRHLCDVQGVVNIFLGGATACDDHEGHHCAHYKEGEPGPELLHASLPMKSSWAAAYPHQSFSGNSNSAVPGTTPSAEEKLHNDL